jgi:hypothetical protein
MISIHDANRQTQKHGAFLIWDSILCAMTATDSFMCRFTLKTVETAGSFDSLNLHVTGTISLTSPSRTCSALQRLLSSVIWLSCASWMPSASMGRLIQITLIFIVKSWTCVPAIGPSFAVCQISTKPFLNLDQLCRHVSTKARALLLCHHLQPAPMQSLWPLAAIGVAQIPSPLKDATSALSTVSLMTVVSSLSRGRPARPRQVTGMRVVNLLFRLS